MYRSRVDKLYLTNLTLTVHVGEEIVNVVSSKRISIGAFWQKETQ